MFCINANVKLILKHFSLLHRASKEGKSLIVEICAQTVWQLAVISLVVFFAFGGSFPFIKATVSCAALLTVLMDEIGRLFNNSSGNYVTFNFDIKSDPHAIKWWMKHMQRSSFLLTSRE